MRNAILAATVLLISAGCSSAPSPYVLAQFDKERAECYDTGHLRYFGQHLNGLSHDECDKRITYLASELERWYAGGPVGTSRFSYTFIAK